MNDIIDSYLNKDNIYSIDVYLDLLKKEEVLKVINDIIDTIDYLNLKNINFENENKKRLIKIYLIINSKNNIQNKYKILNNNLKDDYYEDILNYIKKYRFIDKKLIKKLIFNYKENNSEEIRDIIIYSNQFIIINYVLSLTDDRRLILDLIQEGNVGLLKGLKKYDCNSEVPFHFFAYWYVRKQIDMYYGKNNKLTIKSHKNIELTKNINNYIYNYRNNNFKEPTIDEIIKEFNISKERYVNLMISENILSLYSDKVSEESDEFGIENELINYIYNEVDLIEIIDEKYFIKKVIEEMSLVLNEKRLDVIKKRLGLFEEEKNFVEIAKELNMTKQGAEQKYIRALNKIKRSNNIEKILKS